ncbi:MAG TPA: hypothetical protein VK063_07855 [Beutenbergiaceae bacterium]|nr:hypothetical protein [Beutenbergiaceae bacterium]
MPLDSGALRIIGSLQESLAAAGVPTVLGGSALLASLGLTTQVRDWDLVTDADAAIARNALERLGHAYARRPPTEVYRSAAALTFKVQGLEVDLLVQFAIRTSQGTVAIPARPGATWHGLTMARREDWARAYALMGRQEKAVALAGAGHGAKGRGD